MSFNYDRYDRRQPPTRTRSTLGYWVPLVLTVTVATAGLAAWVWSERRDDEDESSEDGNLSYGDEGDPKSNAPLARDATAHSQPATHQDDLVSRVQGVIRRTPSPQQVFDTVSKKTAAGWAAAGAALASIREEDKDDAYGDHSRWSEEAAIRRNIDAQSAQSSAAVRSAPNPAAKTKTVVLVVSAESLMDAPDSDDYRSENATLLSHLPPTTPTTRLFILIYNPTLRSRPSSPLGSSYASAALTPDDLSAVEPRPEIYTPALSARSSDTLLSNTLHAQAARLVSHPTMLMPFSTPTGFVHMVRHIAPDLVYLVDALTGVNGKNVQDIKRWVGQTVVVVGGDARLAGLVDTDDEVDGEHAPSKRAEWWRDADMVGLGKGVDVVDVARFEDDYERRVGGRE